MCARAHAAVVLAAILHPGASRYFEEEMMLKWIFGILALIVATLILGYFAAPRILGPQDPLSARLRTNFDRIDALRARIVVALAKMKAKQKADLDHVHDLYDAVARDSNQLIKTAVNNIQVGTVDENFLNPSLEAAKGKAESLLAEVDQRVILTSDVNSGDQEKWNFFSGVLELFKDTQQSWERLQAGKDKLKETVITQLNAMKWPDWKHV
jgi:uncharacterized membrane-anchored protein YhcB (DUF1043 family)